jgi:Zn-dependent M28 family amino/carboxypeptidase
MNAFVSILMLSATLLNATPPLSDTTIIKQHLTVLTKTPQPRNYKNVPQLDETANFIKKTFELYTDSVVFQTYVEHKQTFKNVIASFGPKDAPRIIVGAHYDVCDRQPGADDNASGVVGLLELARLLKGQTLKNRIDLVAYSLEEPPYFRSELMGSFVHAESLSKQKVSVLGMVCLEMIGYFKDEPHSQTYPIKSLSMIYGNKGDYITLVRKAASGRFARHFSSKFMDAKTIKTKEFVGFSWVQGIDYSDHLNYWKFGYSALMITDTSFFRNPNYHQPTDTMETLDLNRMSQVIDGVFLALKNF